MRIIALVAFVTLLTAVGAAPQSRGAAPERRATLSGVLLDAANGAAVRRARIEIMSRLSRVGAVMSDDQGRFAVEVPVEAPITARIVKGGYATVTRSITPLQLRQAEPLLVALDRGGAIAGRAVTSAGEPAGVSVVTVRPAGTLPQPPVMPFMPATTDERGEFRIGGLPAGRSVSGTVFDEHREPLQDAGVQLLRVRRSPAGLSAIREQRMLTRTDDRGRFKAMNVMPGDYVMSASIPAHLISGGVRTAYAPVFWPDTGALSAASPLQVRPDEEIGGLVLTLRPVPVVRVSGVARNSTDTPFSGTVRLTPARSADTAATDARSLRMHRASSPATTCRPVTMSCRRSSAADRRGRNTRCGR